MWHTATHAVKNEKALKTVAVLRWSPHTLYDPLTILRPVLVVPCCPDTVKIHNLIKSASQKPQPWNSKDKSIAEVVQISKN